MLDYLKHIGVSSKLVTALTDFRDSYPIDPQYAHRISEPTFHYIGTDIWEAAISALLSGSHLLLAGPKATGKNVLADNLSSAFGRPSWTVSFHVNTDANALIGTDTLDGGEVVLRKGPIYQAALSGGFGVLDEINMAKNDAIAVLHATLDHRRLLDVPGYDKISLHPATRFIATMNYGYVGTRELNEALSSRFLIINMPDISQENLRTLLHRRFPTLKEEYATIFSQLFHDLQLKSHNSEISSKPVDIRGLMDALAAMQTGLKPIIALRMGLVNKSFDDFERELVLDTLWLHLSDKTESTSVFD